MHDAKLRDAWATWLSGLQPWTHFGTYTFGHKVGWWAARRRWADYWADVHGGFGGAILAQSAALFGEVQKRGVPHYHALIRSPHDYADNAIYRAAMEKGWSSGFARVVPILSEGACFYVSKYASKAEYDFDVFGI